MQLMKKHCAPYIKNISGEYEDYLLVTDEGELQGEVFHRR